MKKLRKSKNKKIAGVCQGLAKWLNIDVTYIRAIWILVALFPGIGILSAIGVYALLAYLLPEEKDYIDI